MLISTFTFTNVFTTTTDNLDAAGKRLTYYPSSLFIAHNTRPLITFNDTKIVNVMIKFKPTKMGRAPVLSKTCSPGQKEFMDNILDSLRKSNRATRRLLFLPGFYRLIECGSYVSRMFQTISKIPSTMVCPQAYRTTLKKCKKWALRSCKGLSSDLKTWLSGRSRRSAWACSAGLLGLPKLLYEAGGHSCETNHISELKKTLKKTCKRDGR